MCKCYTSALAGPDETPLRKNYNLKLLIKENSYNNEFNLLMHEVLIFMVTYYVWP